jgi:hypothetical protein
LSISTRAAAEYLGFTCLLIVYPIGSPSPIGARGTPRHNYTGVVVVQVYNRQLRAAFRFRFLASSDPCPAIAHPPMAPRRAARLVRAGREARPVWGVPRSDGRLAVILAPAFAGAFRQFLSRSCHVNPSRQSTIFDTKRSGNRGGCEGCAGCGGCDGFFSGRG